MDNGTKNNGNSPLSRVTRQIRDVQLWLIRETQVILAMSVSGGTADSSQHVKVLRIWSIVRFIDRRKDFDWYESGRQSKRIAFVGQSVSKGKKIDPC